MGEADLVDADASPEQRKLNTIVRSLLRLPPEELSYLPLPLTETTVILENTPEAELLLQAWTQRQLELQEALKHVVKPAESMTKLMQSLTNDQLPSYLSLYKTQKHANDKETPTSTQEKDPLYEQSVVAVKDTFANLEEFLSDIDNARDFHILGLWPQLLSLMDRSYPPLVRSQAAWVVGSAVQGVFAYNNNDKFVRVNANGDENIEENHEWLFEEFSVQPATHSQALDHNNQSSTSTSTSTTGLKLILNMLVDCHQHNDNDKDKSSVVDLETLDDEFVKKTLYVFAAALRGSFETQTLVESLMDTDFPDLSRSLLSLVTHPETLHDTRLNRSLEPSKRVWALAGDLAQELIVVAEEFSGMFNEYETQLLRHLQDTQRLNDTAQDTAASAGDTRTNDVIQRHHDNLQQAVSAMRHTSFLYPQLFPETSFFHLATRVLTHVLETQRTLLTQPAETVSQKQYQGLRVLRREVLRYVASHVSLAQTVTHGCDRFMSPSFSLWQMWFPSFSPLDTLYEGLKGCVAMVQDTVAMEQQKMSVGDAWLLGEDESVVDLIQQSESLLRHASVSKQK